MKLVVKKILKISALLSLAILLLLIALQLFLLTPAGQTLLVRFATNIIYNKTGLRVSIDYIAFKPIDNLRLEKVYVADLKGDTLAYLESLDLSIKRIKSNDAELVLAFGKVKLVNPVFHLHIHQGDTQSRLADVLDLLPSSNDTSTSSTDIIIKSAKVQIVNGRFSFHDYNQALLRPGVDWSHLDLSEIDLDASNFLMQNDTFTALFKNLSTFEKSGFQLDSLAGEAYFSPVRTALENMHIATPNTRLLGNIEFQYDSIADYTEFNTNIRMRGMLADSKIYMEDIAHFAPDLFGLKETLFFDGNVRGTVSNLKARNMNIRFGNSTFLSGNVDMDGLPEIASTFIMLDLKELQTESSDLNQIPSYPFSEGKSLVLPDFLKAMGTMQFKGNFTGFINDFVAYGTLQSAVGELGSDIKLARNAQNEITYSGNLRAQKFNLGKLFSVSEIGNISMNLKVDGKNFDPKEISASVKGKIHKLRVLDYPYNDISLKGEFDKQMFNGELAMQDENIGLIFQGEINLRDEIPNFKFFSEITDAYPVKLNLIERDSSFRVNTKLDINFSGNSINNVLGRASLVDLMIEESGKTAKLERVDFNAVTTQEGKTLSLESENLSAFVSGKFTTTGIVPAIEHMGYALFPSFYSKEPKRAKEEQQFRFKLRLHQISDFTKIFVPKLEVPALLEFEGEINDRNDYLKIDGFSNTFSYGNFQFNKLNLSVLLDSQSLKLDTRINSIFMDDSLFINKLHINNKAQLDEALSTIVWGNANDSGSHGRLVLDTRFYSPEIFMLNIQPSFFTFNDSLFEISKRNYVLFDNKSVQIFELGVSNSSQELLLNGRISNNPNDSLEILLRNIELSSFNSFLSAFNTQLSGSINGVARVRDIYNTPVFTSNLEFQELSLNTHLIGSGTLGSRWDNTLKELNVLGVLKNKDTDVLALNGKYKPNEEEQFDIQVLLDKYPLASLDSYVNEFLSGIKGTTSANIHVGGNTKEPILSGKLKLNDVETRVLYLNAGFSVPKAEIVIESDMLLADLVKVYDENGKLAICNVSIIHTNFEDISYDIWFLTREEFKVLNTTEHDNDIFYGKAILAKGSSVTFESGIGGKLHLVVDAKTEKGTQIFLPLDNPDEIVESSYVRFVNWDEEEEEVTFERNTQTEANLYMDFDLKLTRDAEIQLILDRLTGDIIKASGTGDISLKVDDLGNFQIFGAYALQRGEYTFTLENIINKKFSVSPGSTISWDGDPLAGMADINAVYNLRTNLSDLALPLVVGDTNELKKRIPVDVILKLSGNYMNPLPEFSFKLPERYADFENVLNNLEEGEKNKQVFGLLLLNKFFPVGGAGFAGAGGNAFGKSTSEMLSNQLSNWLSQISNDFDIGVNYRPGDQVTSDEVAVMLSTQLLNDRVNIETNIGVGGNNPAAQQNNQVVGDFLVEYKVSPDGSIRSKAFNRSNVFTPINEIQAPYTQGVGISYQEDFNSAAQFWCAIRRRFASKVRRQEFDCEVKERERVELKRKKKKEEEKAK